METEYLLLLVVHRNKVVTTRGDLVWLLHNVDAHRDLIGVSGLVSNLVRSRAGLKILRISLGLDEHNHGTSKNNRTNLEGKDNDTSDNLESGGAVSRLMIFVMLSVMVVVGGRGVRVVLAMIMLVVMVVALHSLGEVDLLGENPSTVIRLGVCRSFLLKLKGNGFKELGNLRIFVGVNRLEGINRIEDRVSGVCGGDRIGGVSRIDRVSGVGGVGGVLVVMVVMILGVLEVIIILVVTVGGENDSNNDKNNTDGLNGGVNLQQMRVVGASATDAKSKDNEIERGDNKSNNAVGAHDERG
jgi:hypothetical protein